MARMMIRSQVARLGVSGEYEVYRFKVIENQLMTRIEEKHPEV